MPALLRLSVLWLLQARQGSERTLQGALRKGKRGKDTRKKQRPSAAFEKSLKRVGIR